MLKTIELPALESSFQFSLIANDVLTAVDLSALEVVDNSFTATSNDSLSTLELPALASVGFGVPFGTIGYGVEIQFNSSLTLIESPNLSVVYVDLDPGYPAIWTQVNARGSFMNRFVTLMIAPAARAPAEPTQNGGPAGTQACPEIWGEQQQRSHQQKHPQPNRQP